MLISTVIIIILISAPLSAILVNHKDWKYYSKVYKTLNKDDWSFNGDFWWIYNPNGYPNKVPMCWFGNGNIKLNNDAYLFKFHPAQFDPYHLYWYIKYNNWFKANLLNK